MIYGLIQQEEMQLQEPNTHKLASRRRVGSGRSKECGRKKLLTLFLLKWTCSIVLVSWTLANGEPFKVTLIGTETWLTLQPQLKEMYSSAGFSKQWHS